MKTEIFLETDHFADAKADLDWKFIFKMIDDCDFADVGKYIALQMDVAREAAEEEAEKVEPICDPLDESQRQDAAEHNRLIKR